ncbi:MAG: nitrogenase cofactor biosynthesis protein NifB [Planctomycetaceae bacterium]|jgi:nitrogen fixation protein NifB|nr:nitrogenase cofactor biosynthesis protein NifB [Planctomycetaceae bacterium]
MFENHPCFSETARHQTGRVHLPVATKCNIQCNYCNRKYDCANESRPGVSSVVLNPAQALTYLDAVLKQVDNIAVVGIAGPGDPFANPVETIRTLELVHEKYPDKILCLATNGLGLAEYVDNIAALNISHVTITMNTVDPEIGSQIYAWFRFGSHVYRGTEGAKILLERQTECIKKLKSHGIIVKINTVVVPGVNDNHVVDVARYCRELGADVQNCIPLMHIEETVFEKYPVPTAEEMNTLRKKTEQYLPQMLHCTRCRSDAVGMLGIDNSYEINRLLREAAIVKPTAERPYVAAASMEGLFVNRHLGEAANLCVFGKKENKIVLLEQRTTPVPGSGDLRWRQLAEIFRDCVAVLVSGCGQNPQRILEENGLRVLTVEGLISESIPYIFAGKELPKILLRTPGVCNTGRGCQSMGCRGSGSGCG